MEDYNRMRPAPVKVRHSLSHNKQGLFVETGELRVLISSIDAPWGRPMIDAFRSCGCKVAFMSTDSRDGAKTAQTTGSLFYPGDGTEDGIAQALTYLKSHWGGVDAVFLPAAVGKLELPEKITKIVIGDEDNNAKEGAATYINIADAGVDMAALGRFCVFLCSGSGKGLRGQSFWIVGA